MSEAILTISSKNFSSWSLRGWLLVKFSGLPFTEKLLPPDDEFARAEMLLLAPSCLVPSLAHKSLKIWDTMAIAEYLHEICRDAKLYPDDLAVRTLCRSICGEMHSGFTAMRAALPMNLKGNYPAFKPWTRAQDDIDRITEIWTDCLKRYGGPFLLGERSIADAMYAPVVTRFRTYDVNLNDVCDAYCRRIMGLPEMAEWIAAAKVEQEEIEDLTLETEF